jgi:hypothetical protein
LLTRPDVNAAVGIRPTPSSFANEDIYNTLAWFQIDDKFALSIRLVHGGNIVVGIKISVGVVRADIFVNCLSIFDFHLRPHYVGVPFMFARLRPC